MSGEREDADQARLPSDEMGWRLSRAQLQIAVGAWEVANRGGRRSYSSYLDCSQHDIDDGCISCTRHE